MEGRLKFMSFSSGSCGNCYYLGDGARGVIIDAGVSLRRLKKVMGEEGMDSDSFQAVLVTHEHLDHIRHLGAFCKRLSKPVFTTAQIHDALSHHTFTRGHIAPCRKVIAPGVWHELFPGVQARPFVVPHDARETVGYALRFDGYNFVIMTDIGRMTDEAVELSREARTVVIESNYDIAMLLAGPYDARLKKRIFEECGHLSNDDCAAALRRIAHEGLDNVFLCHRSENNNTRQLAFECSRAALDEAGASETALRVLPREYPSPVFEL